MKKAILLITISLLTLSITHCEKDHDFEGFSYQITSRGASISKRVSLNKTTDGDSNYITPTNVDLAFSKIIFPSIEDAKNIVDANPNIRDQYPVASIDNYLENGIVAINQSTNDPFLVSLGNTGILTVDSIDLGLEDKYFGAIMQFVYYQFMMEDFSIRWYVNDSGPYKAMDVLIKQESNDQWKYAYQRVHVVSSESAPIETYTLELFDTRQESLFFTTWEQSVVADDGDLMHLALHQQDDYLADNGGGSFIRSPALLAYNLQSSADIQNGFGRIDDEIIGITLVVLYSFTGESTNGMQFGGVQLGQPDKMTFSDLSQETSTAIKLYPIKSVEYDVIYDTAE